jgi:hypothetical protein
MESGAMGEGGLEGLWLGGGWGGLWQLLLFFLIFSVLLFSFVFFPSFFSKIFFFFLFQFSVLSFLSLFSVSFLTFFSDVEVLRQKVAELADRKWDLPVSRPICENNREGIPRKNWSLRNSRPVKRRY